MPPKIASTSNTSLSLFDKEDREVEKLFDSQLVGLIMYLPLNDIFLTPTIL